MNNELFLRQLNRRLENQDFVSEEELQAFLNKFVNSQPNDPTDHLALCAEEEAIQLAFRARESDGPESQALARKALELDPDCADAFLVLCATAETIQEAKAFADQALAAAARKLGPEPLQEGGLVGEFWGHVITRPYMRALHEVAELCYAMGAKEEAVQHYREMLRLNPSDNLGVRYTLSPLLIELDLDREATLLMKTYARDNSAFFLYSKALIQFRKSPNTKTARKAMERAFLSNPNVAAIIVAEGPEAFPDHYTPGSPEEAALIVRAHAGAWNENFEFIPWMLQISLEVIQASYSQ